MEPWTENAKKCRLLSRVLLGLALIGLGVVAFIHHLGYLDLALSGRLWPLALIFLGVLRLLARGPFHWGGHALVLGGLCWLAGAHGHQHLVHRFWPLILVWVGLVVLARGCFQADSHVQGRFCDDAREGDHDTRS